MLKSNDTNASAVLSTVSLLLQQQGEGAKTPSGISVVFAEPRQRFAKPKEGQSAFVVDRLTQGIRILSGETQTRQTAWGSIGGDNLSQEPSGFCRR